MAKATLSDELNKITDFEPALTDEQVDALEKSASDVSRGVQRRLVLLACTSSSFKLRQLSEESPDAFIEMLEMIQAFGEHAKGLSEIAESALARMLLAGGAADTSSEEVTA